MNFQVMDVSFEPRPKLDKETTAPLTVAVGGRVVYRSRDLRRNSAHEPGILVALRRTYDVDLYEQYVEGDEIEVEDSHVGSTLALLAQKGWSRSIAFRGDKGTYTLTYEITSNKELEGWRPPKGVGVAKR